jgi:hypothetical protein
LHVFAYSHTRSLKTGDRRGDLWVFDAATIAPGLTAIGGIEIHAFLRVSHHLGSDRGAESGILTRHAREALAAGGEE